MSPDLLERYWLVQERISQALARAGRKPGETRLLAVSKFHPPEAIGMLAKAGQTDFGENYVQEATSKQALFDSDLAWHLIGHLQSRKVKDVIGKFALIHSLDSVKLGGKLEQCLAQSGLIQPVLIEVNIGGETQKSGVLPEKLEDLAIYVQKNCPHLRLDGLMCMLPANVEGDSARPMFAKLRDLRDQTSRNLGLALPELSMGMSGDFEAAILEGATIVRIGSAIFGPRHGGQIR